MARRYDTRTTMFSPTGRLYQVEYAIKATGCSPTCLGIHTKDGIVFAIEKKNTNALADYENAFPKICKLHDVAGIKADARVLINQLRLHGQRHLLRYGEPMPCEQLVKSLCNVKQAYTQFGGKRPFGVAFLYMGWDKHFGFQLYQSDPRGNYVGWKAACIGSKSIAANSMLKKDYKEGLSLEEAKALAIKILSKTLDTAKVSPDKLEIATLTRVNDKTKMDMLKETEIQTLINENAEKEEKARKKREAGSKLGSSSST